MKVIEGTVVFFRYIMKNSRGEVIENIMGGPSKSYLHGGSTIEVHLQRQFDGLDVGGRKEFSIATGPDEKDRYSFEVVIDGLRPASATELALGYPVMATASDCGPGCEC